MAQKICIAVIGLLLSTAIFAQDKMKDLVKSKSAFRKGHNYLSQFKAPEAYAAFDSALYYANKANDEFLLGVSLSGIGQALWYMSKLPSAIDSMNRALYYLRREQSITKEWELPSALRIISNMYDQAGNYVKAFETVRESVDLALKSDDRQNKVLSLVQLGALYNTVGDYTTGMMYYQQANDLKPMPTGYPYRELHRQMGVMYTERGVFDSAQFHYQLALRGHPSPRNIYLRIGESFLLQGNYDTAYRYLQEVYPNALAIADVPILTPTLLGLGKIYLVQGKLDSALVMAKTALKLAIDNDGRAHIKNASLLLSEIYSVQKDSAKAFLYHQQYVLLKDSLLSEQFKGKLFSFKKNIEGEQQQRELRLLKWSVLVIALIAFFVIIILILRHKHEKLKLQQRSDELKMQALRAQMNPHFIFNCLSAINHFILKGDTDTASDYLTRFSRLIRLVLVNAEKNSISLEEELGMLKLYLDMEQLRFKDAFDYHIRYDADIQPSMVEVPSFILQPFCENAIWHGLLHKEGKGELMIDLAMKDDAMICTITDNGIGMVKAAENKARLTEKKGSYGLALTTERLALFNDQTKAAGFFRMEDITDTTGKVTGTKVVLSIKNKKYE